MQGTCTVTPNISRTYDDWARYNGICRQCDRKLSVYAQRAEYRDPQVGWTTGFLDAQGRLWHMSRQYVTPLVDCPDCAKTVTTRQVIGTLNPSKACNAKCMCATGPSCECACGGANHGAGNSF